MCASSFHTHAVVCLLQVVKVLSVCTDQLLSLSSTTSPSISFTFPFICHMLLLQKQTRIICMTSWNLSKVCSGPRNQSWSIQLMFRQAVKCPLLHEVKLVIGWCQVVGPPQVSKSQLQNVHFDFCFHVSCQPLPHPRPACTHAASACCALRRGSGDASQLRACWK